MKAVVSAAGANFRFTANGIQEAIVEAGFTPRLRNQQYELTHRSHAADVLRFHLDHFPISDFSAIQFYTQGCYFPLSPYLSKSLEVTQFMGNMNSNVQLIDQDSSINNG